MIFGKKNQQIEICREYGGDDGRVNGRFRRGIRRVLGFDLAIFRDFQTESADRFLRCRSPKSAREH